MATDTRNRFLIALSKFLGVTPSRPKLVRNLAVCRDWLFDETLDQILRPDSIKLDLENFNRLMLKCRRPMATRHFFAFFFEGVDSIERFEAAVEAYRTRAMWLYGNFRYAYKLLATSSKADFEAEMSRAERRDPTIYKAREPFEEIEKISVHDLDLLGYISGDKIKDLEVAVSLLEQLSAATDLKGALRRLGAEKLKKTSEALVAYGLKFPKSRTAISERIIKARLRRARETLADVSQRQDKAILIGQRNTERYLTLPHLDVYVATSMRDKGDFVAQNEFINKVFSHPAVAPLKLRYFDPTLSYVGDRITKGLIEMLMLMRATVTIYNAGAGDTFGKDSEVAATLAQGKSVIVYAETENRAKMFRVDHPLGLQIAINTGVAHGIIVVKTAKECAEMLRKVILQELEFDVVHEGGNYKLREKTTGSVVRVVSDDPYLTHSFWTYYHRQRSS